MSKLIEVYAKDMGVKIGTPVLPTHYIPIPFEKYITIHTSDKVPAKNYSYWEIVIKILKKEFESRNIKIIQIGTKQDPHLEGVDIFYNDTTFKQTFFIIKNSLLHVGIDSCPVHIASAYGVPTVSVYGHTYAGTCGPVWKNKRVILEPFRNKKCQSFSLSEHPKSVDSIPVEKIANAVFKTLGFSSFKSEKTLHTGSKFLHKTIDIIPATNNFLDKILNAKIRVRMDLSFDENSLVDILKHTENKIEIITERLVNKDILNYFKSKIEKVVYNSAQFDPEFLEYLKYSNIKFELNILILILFLMKELEIKLKTK